MNHTAPDLFGNPHVLMVIESTIDGPEYVEVESFATAESAAIELERLSIVDNTAKVVFLDTMC